MSVIWKTEKIWLWGWCRNDARPEVILRAANGRGVNDTNDSRRLTVVARLTGVGGRLAAHCWRASTVGCLGGLLLLPLRPPSDALPIWLGRHRPAMAGITASTATSQPLVPLPRRTAKKSEKSFDFRLDFSRLGSNCIQCRRR